ncbi:hypothetical protein HPB49_002322 [Dermacentor silvarum]|uniref:Uncharacterized protein n=1 Tax=Dermacentor silvarum TaxID=543639 RepID=A0ACB8CJD4_DERSI|nr:hypothetical protein HPB49_002322 [Dermacentor silvarum]
MVASVRNAEPSSKEGTGRSLSELQVFCGLMLKLVSIVATILTVSTLGNFIFHWNHIPDWFSLPATPNTTGAVVGHQQG